LESPELESLVEGFAGCSEFWLGFDGFSKSGAGLGAGGCTVEGASGMSCEDCALAGGWLCFWPDCAKVAGTARQTDKSTAAASPEGAKKCSPLPTLKTLFKPCSRLPSALIATPTLKKTLVHPLGCQSEPNWCI
jgi:hypothetical protein